MGERRITGTVGTIPNYTALAGTVTSNTDTTVLSYSGSDDIATIMPDGMLGSNSTMWIYVPAGTPKIAKVLGKFKNADNDWSIFLDTGISGASASACSYVPAAITYSYYNDGAGNVTIDGVIIKPGESNNLAPYETYSNRAKFQDPCYVDATAGDLLINEEI